MSFAGRAATLLVLAAAIGIGAGLGIHALTRGDASPATGPAKDLMGQATWGPGERLAPDFVLPDQDGRPTSPAALRGRDVLLTFIRSRCLRSCAREERSLATSLRLLPRPARPAIVAVSLDPLTPARDSIEGAARRLGFGAAPSWHWVFGSKRQLAPVWRSYGIGARVSAAARRPLAYLIDPTGHERAGFLYPFPPNWLAQDVRILAAET